MSIGNPRRRCVTRKPVHACALARGMDTGWPFKHRRKTITYIDKIIVIIMIRLDSAAADKSRRISAFSNVVNQI